MYNILHPFEQAKKVHLAEFESNWTVKKIPMDVYRISIIILKRYLDLMDYFLISPPLM